MYQGALVSGFVNIPVYFNKLVNNLPKKICVAQNLGGCSPHRPPPPARTPMYKNPTKPAGLIRITTCDSLD